MKPYTSHVKYTLGSLVFLLLIAGCGSTQSVFSEQAYRQAVSLKVESLELMDKATGDYAGHEQQVANLQTKLSKAHQYAEGRPNNQTSARQWAILIDPERNLLGGFLNRWEQQGSMSQTFIGENKKLISDAFDTIIKLESGKIKPSDLE